LHLPPRLPVVAAVLAVAVEIAAEAITVMVVLLARQMDKTREPLLLLCLEPLPVVAEIVVIEVETATAVAVQRAQQHPPQQMQPQMTAETTPQVRLPVLQATVAAVSPL